MGYGVGTTGRVRLPVEREHDAFRALSAAMADRDGWFDPDDEEWPVSSLADLASFASASVERDGEWLVLSTDEEGDPKWSEQATAFYVELASWVTEGTVLISGEEGLDWSYTYADGAVTQSGINGWDGSAEPFGDPVDEDAVGPLAIPVAPTSDARRKRAWFRRR